jgi:uncharacterized membrane protein
MRVTVALPVAALLLLSACGTNTVDRTATGAAIGAGAGALVGWAVGMPLGGAVVGGAVGATAGGLTTPAQIDLGKPVWE